MLPDVFPNDTNKVWILKTSYPLRVDSSLVATKTPDQDLRASRCGIFYSVIKTHLRLVDDSVEAVVYSLSKLLKNKSFLRRNASMLVGKEKIRVRSRLNDIVHRPSFCLFGRWIKSVYSVTHRLLDIGR